MILLKFFTMFCIVIYLSGCASAKLQPKKKVFCEPIYSKSTELVDSLVKVRAVPNYQDVAIFLNEERLKADIKIALDQCAAEYSFDFSRAVDSEKSTSIKNHIGYVGAELNAELLKLRKEFDASLEVVLSTFNDKWMHLLAKSIKENRGRYNFELVKGCENEADSMSRSIVANMGKNLGGQLNSPIYFLYNKCIEK